MARSEPLVSKFPGGPTREEGVGPTRQERVEAWRSVQARALDPKDKVAADRQIGRGKLLARERIGQLLDAGSFRELRLLATTSEVPTLAGRRAYGDGIVAGWGTVEGRRVFVFAQDPTVIGGSLGEVGGSKVHRIMDLAIDAGAPIIGINDGGGARIQEGVASLCAFGGIFHRNVRASGVVPQISLIMGAATGGAVYSPALTDFVLMVEGTATMAITGPKVVKAVNGEDITIDDLGGAAVHATRSGVVHFVAPDEPTGLGAARRLLGFLPQNHREAPPTSAGAPPRACTPDPLDLLPRDPDAAYDVRTVVATLVDGSDLFEYAARWAPNVVCGFARLQGRAIGLVANQPVVGAGRLDPPSCEKAARFLRTCDAFNLPVVTLVDCPGLVETDAARQAAMVRAAAKLAYAYAEATSPLVHLIIGRAQGTAAVTLGATPDLSDLCLAWPTAEGAHEAATQGLVDQVIEPRHSRAALIDALAVLASAAPSTAPPVPPFPRKHDNLPL